MGCSTLVETPRLRHPEHPGRVVRIGELENQDASCEIVSSGHMCMYICNNINLEQAIHLRSGKEHEKNWKGKEG